MKEVSNIRTRGNYTCFDFPKQGVSLLYNYTTKEYDFYERKSNVKSAPIKHKTIPEIKVAQIVLIGVLGVVLAVHLLLLVSKFL